MKHTELNFYIFFIGIWIYSSCESILPAFLSLAATFIIMIYIDSSNQRQREDKLHKKIKLFNKQQEAPKDEQIFTSKVLEFKQRRDNE